MADKQLPEPLQLAFRKLGAQLLKTRSRQDGSRPLRILLTGSQRRVGTSTIAEGLARTLAAAHQGSVLLVGGYDASVAEPGEAASRSATLQRMDALPSEGGDERNLAQLLEVGSEGYAFVILDRDPIAESLETQLYANLCDVAWLVVASGTSEWRRAQTAAEILRATNAKETGVIYNRKGRGLPRWLQRITDRAAG